MSVPAKLPAETFALSVKAMSTICPTAPSIQYAFAPVSIDTYAASAPPNECPVIVTSAPSSSAIFFICL